MSVGILGNKVGMTQIFNTTGEVIPVTIIKSGPCYVTQIKSTEKCGYDAVQIGYAEIAGNSRNLTKPRLGHFSKVNLQPFRYLKEYKLHKNENYEIGQQLDVDLSKLGKQ